MLQRFSRFLRLLKATVGQLALASALKTMSVAPACASSDLPQAMKIVFNNIIETSLIQADTDMKVHPVTWMCMTRRTRRLDGIHSQGLGPVDHQLLRLHLGTSRHADRCSHSLGSEA